MNEAKGGRSSHVGRDNFGVVVTGDRSSVHVHAAHGADWRQHLSNGERHLRLGMYEKALDDFNQAMEAGPEDPEIYYLAAVATLKGRKAFMASLAQIRECESLIHCALRLKPTGIFCYFLAYLAFDYYERKFLRAPAPSGQLLEQAWSLGVTPAEVERLFTLLSVRNPLPVSP